MRYRHPHKWVWSGPAEAQNGFEYCYTCGVMPASIEVEAFPDSRQGHVEGAECPCHPFRDSEQETLLVHRRLAAA